MCTTHQHLLCKAKQLPMQLEHQQQLGGTYSLLKDAAGPLGRYFPPAGTAGGCLLSLVFF